MTNAIYFDCFSGISGDMALGALLDAGLSLYALRAEVAKLDVAGWTTEREWGRAEGRAHRTPDPAPAASPPSTRHSAAWAMNRQQPIPAPSRPPLRSAA